MTRQMFCLKCGEKYIERHFKSWRVQASTNSYMRITKDKEKVKMQKGEASHCFCCDLCGDSIIVYTECFAASTWANGELVDENDWEDEYIGKIKSFAEKLGEI